MTPHAARILATRIREAWSGQWTATTAEWVDALEPLDEGHAGAVFARMSREMAKPPTIVQFVDAVRARTPSRPEPPTTACARCASTGWVEALTFDSDGNEHIAGVRPCHCPHGEQRAAAYDAAVNAPDRPTAPRQLTDDERARGRARLAELRAQLTGDHR